MREKIKSHDIDGYTYTVVQLPATVGRKLSVEFARAIVPAVAALVGDKTDGGGVSGSELQGLMGKKVDAAGLQKALDSLFANLPDTRIDEIMQLLSQHTDIYGPEYGDQGAPLDKQFDEHFAGRYKAMYRWLLFAVRVNFQDFFDGFGVDPKPEGTPPR